MLGLHNHKLFESRDNYGETYVDDKLKREFVEYAEKTGKIIDELIARVEKLERENNVVLPNS